MYYSKTTGGFYDEAIHGARFIHIQDPEWVRPTFDFYLEPGATEIVGDQEVSNDGDEPLLIEGAPDMSITAPTVQIENPACLIPADAVEVSADEHAALMAGQGLGKVIAADQDGRPVLLEPVAIPLTRDQIEALRLSAYADPLIGSDRYFSEANRMQAMGESTWEAVRAAGVARYQAIQAEYPWP